MTYSGPPRVDALGDVSLCISAGDYVSIVGRSGSGKSTLMNVLGLLDRPTSGSVLIDGVDTRELCDRDISMLRACRIGFVFQAFHLLADRSVLENIAMPLMYRGIRAAERRRAASDVLDAVGLRGRADQSARTLSGGERQRVALARALVGRPGMILCDEPTGNLDSANAANVLELLADLHGAGVAVVVVTHDPDVASQASRTIRVADGVVG